MELPELRYSKEDYIETASGNKVCRQSVLCGSQNIVLNGKTIISDGCVVRGDLANIRIGRFCVIRSKSIIRPPFKKFSKGVAFFPMHIGDHVYIGEDTVLNAAAVGSYTHIGANCVIGRRAVLKDCCAVLEGSVLAAETVVPPFAIMAGSPAKIVGRLPECTQDLMIDATKSFYQNADDLISHVKMKMTKGLCLAPLGRKTITFVIPSGQLNRMQDNSKLLVFATKDENLNGI